jgi:hypothetical protein
MDQFIKICNTTTNVVKAELRLSGVRLEPRGANFLLFDDAGNQIATLNVNDGFFSKVERVAAAVAQATPKAKWPPTPPEEPIK